MNFSSVCIRLGPPPTPPTRGRVRKISVIKQSASSLISILTLMALSFGVMLIFGYFGSSIGYDICFVFIVLGYLLMDIILYVILIKWGVNKYIALSI